MNDPGSFFVQMEKHASLLESVEDAIEAVVDCEQSRKPERRELMVGAIYLAPFQDQCQEVPDYYRARLDS